MAARVYTDISQQMTGFESAVRRFELLPESRIRAVVFVEIFVGHAERKNMNGNIGGNCQVKFPAKPVQFPDMIVADGNAADTFIAAVDINIAADLLLIFIADAVGFIGIIDAHRQTITAIRIEKVDAIKSFGDLSVALAVLGSKVAGACSKSI